MQVSGMDVILVSTYVIQQTVKYKNICRFAAKTSLLNYCLSKQLVVFSLLKVDLRKHKMQSGTLFSFKLQF